MKKTRYLLQLLIVLAFISCDEEISDNPFVGKWDGVKTGVGYNYTSNGDSILSVSSDPIDFKLTLKADGTGTLKADKGFGIYDSEISWSYNSNRNRLYFFWQLEYSVDNGYINSQQTRILKVDLNERNKQVWRSTSYRTGEISQDTVYVGYATWELERD